MDDVLIVGPEMLQEMVDKVKIIQQNMKAVQDRHKVYVARRRKPLKFKEGDKVFLKVSPVQGL